MSDAKTITSSIVDNRDYGSVGAFLNNAINPGSNLSFVSAYFTIFAYQRLKEKLDDVDHLRFLFGEPAFIKSLAGDTANKRRAEFLDDALTVSVAERLDQRSVAMECAEWIREKVEVRSMIKPNFLHGKLYLIENANGVKESLAGSSNFTVNGLGLGSNPNMELNLVINDKRDVNDLAAWFDKLWNNTDGLVEDVKDRVLDYLEQLSAENQPQFIYYKTLFHIFGDYLQEQRDNRLLDDPGDFMSSEIWQMLYDFQRDGVKGAINKILKHNGCIIADSVGLGKTFEALAVIQYFERRHNDFRVLVLCPKSLAANWSVYQTSKNSELSPFIRDKYKFNILYHTDMGRKTGKSTEDGVDLETFKWGNYDLVVIDESHNFRGNPTEKTTDDGSIKMNRAKWLMDKIIKDSSDTKVLLLSATPVNNNLRDLRNQLMLITKGEADALEEKTGIRNISTTLEGAQRRFTTWADPKNKVRLVKTLIESLDSSFFKLLDELTIARSREHIRKFYDLEAIGGFSVRNKPISIYPDIDLDDSFFSYDALNTKILQYKLAIFNPSKYVLPGKEKIYGIKTKEEKAKERKEKLRKEKARKERKGKLTQQSLLPAETNFDQGDRENFLIGMMKINFLKRLESSVESFEISMLRTVEKIKDLEKEIRDFKQLQGEQDYDLADSAPDEDFTTEDENELDAFTIGKKLPFKLKHLDLDEWLSDLESDRDALYELYLRAKDVTPERDGKLKDLKDAILAKLENPINEGNKKVIVFTAFTDTATYLYDELESWAKDELSLNIALVSGKFLRSTFGKPEFGNILTNFSPMSKDRSRKASMPQDGEIDILIATDCISEGQNLQDCDFLINYDIHWNPVRIIQRFGRIDRLGSKNANIQLVNFWATDDLDKYINLKNRVEARMALVDVTATGEENILNTEQIEELIEGDLKYRDQQLKKLKDEVLDLEDMNESVSLTDFTLDDFRQDLLNFLQEHKDTLEAAPLGLYAVTPSPFGEYAVHDKKADFKPNEREIVRPGVIFCLRQIAEAGENEAVNPLQPYFLVYIYDTGDVRYNYANSKQVLEVFRRLCEGKTEAYDELCGIFNRQTGNGKDMQKYSDLLKKAVAAITASYKKRSSAKLTMDRNAVIAPVEKQVSNLSDFELITWLVIK